MTRTRSGLLLGLLIAAAAGPASAQDGLPLPRAQSTPAVVARSFYDAFCSSDFATMDRLYAPDVRFKDEIFTFDDRAGTMGMWRVLLAPDAGGRFSYELLEATGDTATVRWIADYRFLGRPVHNEITARLVIRGGRIVEHHDAFSWERWARQALPLGRFSTFKPVAHLIKAGLRVGLKVSAMRAGSPAPSAEAASSGQAAPASSRGITDAIPGR